METIEGLKKNILASVCEAVLNLYGIEMPEKMRLGFPPRPEFGDFAIGCFLLTNLVGKSPAAIAKEITGNIVSNNFLAQASGPYVNFQVNPEILFNAICDHKSVDESFWAIKIPDKSRVMVEYLSPNTNKPLHLGHVRNGVLGMAISNILGATGHKVVKANLVNDRGVHICKSMHAWQVFGMGQTPENTGKKGDHLVGDFYVSFSKELEAQCNKLREANPDLKDASDDDLFLETEIGQRAHEMLQKWEAGDTEVRELWQMMNDWVYKGFEETYRAYGFDFDRFYYESDTYKLGKDMVDFGLASGIFAKNTNGSTVVALPEKDFGLNQGNQAKFVTLLRPNGTSLYMTQDLGTAKLKYDDYQLDRSIYVVATEQDYHFQCLFWILKQLGFAWAEGCHHFSYGMVNLPEGRMKSREGTVVDADDLLEGMIQFSLEAMKEKNSSLETDDPVIQERARKIALGAIKFYLLQVSPKQTIQFDPKSSLSFDGCTGIYCQYAFARADAIVSKASPEEFGNLDPDFSQLGNVEEKILAQSVIDFPYQLQLAAQELNPARLVTAVYQLCQNFNQFYEKHKVLGLEDKSLTLARLKLVKVTMHLIKKGLNLLGISELKVV